MTRRLLRRRRLDERGQLGGVEVLPFGFLVFVVGTLIVVNAWGVVDAKLATEAASREAVRVYVESPDEATALVRSHDAAIDAARGHGKSIAALELRPPPAGSFARCTRVTYEVRYRLPVVRVPWVGSLGRGLTATSRHSEVVDPYRSGLAVDALNGASCGG
jgi:hypothetical protein